MEMFHHFLYGNHFLLETDQKPLETILSRSLIAKKQIVKDTHQNISLQFQCVLPARLKKPASRLFVQSRGLQDSIKLPKLSVYQITSQLNARSDSLQQLHEATKADDTLAILNIYCTEWVAK